MGTLLTTLNQGGPTRQLLPLSFQKAADGRVRDDDQVRWRPASSTPKGALKLIDPG